MDIVNIAGNPMPKGALVGYLDRGNGVRLRYALWRARDGQGKGTVCLFSGRTEFIEKYFEIINELLDRGFSVATMDWRGQGRSTRLLRNPRKGHVSSFADYYDDLQAFIETIVLPECTPPFFVLAHSMGASVVLKSLCHREWFTRAVLVSPMVGLSTRWVSYKTLKTIVHTMATLGFGKAFIPGGKNRSAEERGFDDNHLTSDLRRFQRVQTILTADPALGLGSPTFGWLSAALRHMRDLGQEEFGQTVSVPTLVVAGGHEQVVSYLAIETLCRKMPKGALVTIDGARHEIMMERDIYREQFWGAFDAFVPGSGL